MTIFLSHSDHPELGMHGSKEWRIVYPAFRGSINEVLSKMSGNIFTSSMVRLASQVLREEE